MANFYDNEDFFQGYMDIRKQKLNYNNSIEEPLMLEIIGDVNSKTILDLGCGTGELSKKLSKNAKDILGIDISQKMLDVANKNNNNINIKYKNLPMENINILNQKFDVVVSSLAFHYIENFQKLIIDISRLLKKRGSLIFSQEHPMITAYMGERNWISDLKGNKLYWPVSNYNDEGLRSETWFIENVQKYHRTLSTIINTLIENGFEIERIFESKANDELIKTNPKFLKGKNISNFLFIKAKKT